MRSSTSHPGIAPVARVLASAAALVFGLPTMAGAEGAGGDALAEVFDVRALEVGGRGVGPVAASPSPLGDRSLDVQFDGRSAWDDQRRLGSRDRARVPSRREAPRAGMVRTETRSGTRFRAAALRPLGLAPIEGSHDLVRYAAGTSLTVALGDHRGPATPLPFLRQLDALGVRSLSADRATVLGRPALRIDAEGAARGEGSGRVVAFLVGGTQRHLLVLLAADRPLAEETISAVLAAIEVPSPFDAIEPDLEAARALLEDARLGRLPSLELAALGEWSLSENPSEAAAFVEAFGHGRPAHARTWTMRAADRESEGVTVLLAFSPMTAHVRTLVEALDEADGRPVVTDEGSFHPISIGGWKAVATEEDSTWVALAPVSENHVLTLAIVGDALVAEETRAAIVRAVRLPFWLRPEAGVTDELVVSQLGFGRSASAGVPSGATGPGRDAPGGDAREWPAFEEPSSAVVVGQYGWGVYGAYHSAGLLERQLLLGLSVGGFLSDEQFGAAVGLLAHYRRTWALTPELGVELSLGPQLALGTGTGLGVGIRGNLLFALPFGGQLVAGAFAQAILADDVNASGIGLSLGYQLPLPGH